MKKALPFLLALLSACGGGGSTPFVSIDTVTPGSVALDGYAGLPAPNLRWSLSFIGDLSALDGQTVYIGVVVAGGPAYGAPSFWVSGANTLEVVVTAAAPEPAPAHYEGTATLYLCFDENCTKQFGRSPWPTTFTIDVAPGIRFSQPSLAIEAPFGVTPAPQRVDVILPAGASNARFTATADPALHVVGDGTTGFVATGALAPAGSYASTASVQVGVPDPNGGYDPVTLRATLPVSYTVLPDPARPFLLIPASHAFRFSPTTTFVAQDSSYVALLQQVAGGRLEFTGARYLEAPAGAASSALAVTWLTFPSTGPGTIWAKACTGYAPSLDCLPPGTYRAALTARYLPASGDPSVLELPVEMVVEPTCDGASPDFQGDEANCGACFRHCGTGFACTGGTCQCGAGRSICGPVCRDLQTDAAACGACFHACPAGRTCQAGSCCPAGQVECAGTCVDLATSASHCGACGHACQAPLGCYDGACACAPGQTLCSFACRDLSADARNCGGCGVTCATGQSCENGACACPAGQTLCGGACRDMASDAAHCGACGVTCANGEACLAGACACAPGSQACPPQAACLVLSTDAEHCGACGNRCPAGQGCVDGACAPQASFGMLAGDAGHSGYVAAENGGPPLTLAWSTPIAGGFVGPPVVEGGRVVVLTSSGLQAFEAANGAPIWQRAVTGGWPALVDGQIYLAGGSFASASVRQFERATGEPGFVAAIESQRVQFWSPIVVGSALYTNGGLYGGLYGLDVSAGGTQLFFDNYGNTYSNDMWSPAFADGVLYTYLGDLLRAHDPVTGAVTASRVISPFNSGGMYTVPVLAGGRGFVVTRGVPYGGLEAFAAGTLERLWRIDDSFTAYPAVADGVVYVTAEGPFRDTQLRAYDAATGALRWATEYHWNLQGPPLVAGRTAYLSGSVGTWGVDLGTHAVTYLTAAHGNMAIWNGYLVVNDIGAGYGAASLKVFRLTP